MREIKFRGKTLEDFKSNDNVVIPRGTWIYGGIVYDDTRVWIDTTYYGQIAVDKETVGQYTGLHDKNGDEIYEGDIVTGIDYPFIDEGKQNYVGIVVFYDDAASFGYEYQCVRRDKRGISNGISNEFEANENLVCEDLELLGNITDNKELLNETN